MIAIGLLLRRRVTRLAILVVALAQIGVALTPHTGGTSDATSTRPHLHAIGDQLELPHDEAACPACSGLHLAPRPSAQVRIATAPTGSFRVPESRQQHLESAVQYGTVLSRAPPAIA